MIHKAQSLKINGSPNFMPYCPNLHRLNSVPLTDPVQLKAVHRNMELVQGLPEGSYNGNRYACGGTKCQLTYMHNF